MKKILLIIALISVFQGSQVMAATESTKSAQLDKSKQIDDLKERLATKVAELRQVERRAIFGTVKNIAVASITVETQTKDLKIELTDDIKVFQTLKNKRTTLSTDDIDKGDNVVIFGSYDTTLDVLKASVIIIQNQIPTRISGTIKSTDTKNFTITIESDSGESMVDYETSTKALAWSNNGQDATKVGFSKLNTGDYISVLGYAVPKKENRYSSVRILVVKKESAATGTPGVTPTATTGKTKTTPTVKPTLKLTPTPIP